MNVNNERIISIIFTNGKRGRLCTDRIDSVVEIADEETHVYMGGSNSAFAIKESYDSLVRRIFPLWTHMEDFHKRNSEVAK